MHTADRELNRLRKATYLLTYSSTVTISFAGSP